ncbi:SWIM zinc finger domain-containing protein [Lentzea sp. NPDC060358]|uniref:SWIM zinc finger family protein n=1 Tax=Lentzea sp. NPDC060358 TaxID=3347103 RepID=UPI003662C438
MAVTRSTVRKLADEKSFERGERYFAAGQVRRIEVDGATVTAAVDGTRTYRVRLEVTPKGLRGRCSCPYGAEGVFCKHCVATSLAWLEQGGEVGEPRAKPLSDKRLRLFLRGCEQEWLIDELMRAAKSDRVLRARLAAAAGQRDAFDDHDIRERLERAIDIPDFVDHAEAYGYFLHVGDALDEVERLVGAGFADAAIALAEHALELLETAAERVDDSDGGLSEALARVEEIHLVACAAGSPDPVELAERLVARALSSEYEVFLDVLSEYRDVLGPAGLARYRGLVEQAWRELPPKKANDHSARRFAIAHLMENLAEASGGADGLVEVLARDVTSSYDVLRIAERLCADDRDDEALTWLERGLSDFEPDFRLRDLAAEVHVRANRRDRAGELLWANFTDRPCLATFRALREATAGDFPRWRERALAFLAELPPVRSTLVEVLLAEGEDEAAWRAAVDGGCSESLWLRLARVRAASHPADAIPILLGAADRAIEVRNRDAYQAAVRLLVEAGALFARCDRDDDFRAHLAAVRDAHRTKWALRQELDWARLP